MREELQQDVERLMRLFNSALFSLPLGEHGIALDDSDAWVKSLERSSMALKASVLKPRACPST